MDSRENTSEAIESAIRHLLRRAVGQDQAARIAREQIAQKHKRGTEEHVNGLLRLVRALKDGGRIGEDEYLFYVDSAITQNHEKRVDDGEYDEVLGPIERKMEQIERECGLNEGEYWLLSDAPQEYVEQSKAFDLAYSSLKSKLFRYFGENSLAELRERDPKAFADQRERGRKNVFVKDDELAKLEEVAHFYEEEAVKASRGDAFLAATIMVGSATECRLLQKALNNRESALLAFEEIEHDVRRRRKKRNPQDWGFATLVKVANAAGWLRVFEEGEFVFLESGLADLVKLKRNLVHPDRYVKEHGFVRVGKETFDDVNAAYELLRNALSN